jgi:hypothetical protein
MNDYYVYMYLREDGTPYYVGKGKGNRAYDNYKRRFPIPPKDRIKIVLTNLTEEQAFVNEKDFIAWYGRKDNNTGILRNLTDGGEGMSGYKHTEEAKKNIKEKRKNQVFTDETKKKLSESLKKRHEDGSISPPMLGKHHTKEFKEYLSKLYTGRTVTEEQKRKISIAHKGRKHSPEFGQNISKRQTGKKTSEETKQKQRLASKERWSKMSEEDKIKIAKNLSESNKGRIISEERKAKVSKQFTNVIWINNGIENKVIKKDVEMPDGWIKGRLPYKVKRVLSEEAKRKIGLANSVRLKGNVPWNKGIKKTPDAYKVQ